MPGPTNKAALLEEMEKEHQLLVQSIAKLSIDDLLAPATCGEWSVKDVMAHITEWEQHALSWYRAGLRGEKPKTPDADFGWDQIDALNHAMYLKHREDALSDVRAAFEHSYQELLEAVNAMSEEVLFEPNQFAWTSEYILADLIIDSTSKHYRGHNKDILAWQRAKDKA